MAAQSWQPYESLTKAPTNLKEAIDWVLRVTGKDGKKNKAAQPPPPPGSTNNGPHCLCYLAKAVKDLLYDAKDPGTPGPSPGRYWDGILLDQEQSIVNPVLTDLGLLSTGSTSATTTTCAGGTEVIGALIDQLAQGLQKWVGWQDKGDDCCLKGGSGESKGIGRKCDCNGSVGAGCCNGGKTCHECTECGTGAKGGPEKKCYQSAYSKTTALWTTIVNGTTGGTTNVKTVQAAQEVHLLARIFLGSVCLIWSGLSQLGFLTGKGSGAETRWKESELSKISDDDSSGLGSFMAAMGYDLERLNGSGGDNKDGTFVWKLLSGQEPSGNNGIQWKEFASVKSKTGGSVAEYYSSIYEKAKEVKDKKTEDICKQYPLLVLHILASGYFRAGSAGANKVTPAKPATTSSASVTPSPRKPRTIREILYWLSALPYCDKYRELVQRMGDKTDLVTNGSDDKNKIVLHGEGDGKKTDLHKDKITHYLMAACGYCPLVLIGIQGTIENKVKAQAQSAAPGSGGGGGSGSGSPSEKKKCPEHKKDPHKRCTLEDANKTAEASTQSTTTVEKLQAGQVCYGGYHLEVSKFGPLHGMYANGLFGFDMDLSAAQCLDQLRVYVYHCFYQLYFLRKQCGAEAVLGWESCRYGFQVGKKTGGVNGKWICEIKDGAGGSGSAGSAVGGKGGSGVAGNEHTKSCGLQDGAKSGEGSALQSFLCDAPGQLVCKDTIGKDLNSQKQKYPEIEDHMNMKSPFHPNGHLDNPHRHCPVPMGWDKDKHFKDLTTGTHKTDTLSQPQQGGGAQKYPAHCTGRTLSYLLEYYCDPDKCHGSLVVLLRLLACITPTVPRTLGDLFGFYYYIVYIGGQSGGGGEGDTVYGKLEEFEKESKLYMMSIGGNKVVKALTTWNNSGKCSNKNDTLKCLYKCDNGGNTNKCAQYLSPLSGQQYGQLSPLMAGTYLSWLVYLIEEFKEGLEKLKGEFQGIDCKNSECKDQAGAAGGCGDGQCRAGTHGNESVCCCASVVSCTGVLPVLYKYGFGYGDVSKLGGGTGQYKKCHDFLTTLEKVLTGDHLKKDGSQGGLHHEINKLIYTTRLPWIFVLTLAWLVAVLYLAFGAIWPLDWTHMRSHCRGWFRKGSLSPWEVLMVGKKKGRGILKFFGKT